MTIVGSERTRGETSKIKVEGLDRTTMNSMEPKRLTSTVVAVKMMGILIWSKAETGCAGTMPSKMN
jgi:hypothetical protein